jgi:hypothetical protein
MQITVVQLGLCVTAIATTIIGMHTYYTYLHALNPTYVYGYCHVYCQNVGCSQD